MSLEIRAFELQRIEIVGPKRNGEGLARVEEPSKVCEDFLIGKQHRDSFSKKSPWRVK